MEHEPLKIGIIGLDTSHVTAFAELLNLTDHPYHVPGGKVVAAYPGGSPDFELSYSRVQGFTDTMSGTYGVRIVDSIENVAEACDVILLESVDGRVHLEQFKRIVPYGKPVFIDKPFAVTTPDAIAIAEAARRYRVPLMSCSALRFAEGLTLALNEGGTESIIGMDCYGPAALQQTQPGLFWYGIHTAEMLFAGMGKGCIQVTAAVTEYHEFVTGLWKDGRIGTIRGNRRGNNQFGAVIHRASGTGAADIYAHPKPYYASLLEKIMEMFRTGQSTVELEETLEIIRFIEAANESRETRLTVRL